MAAEALRDEAGARQLALYERDGSRAVRRGPEIVMCAGCRAKEARYGFRDEHRLERPRTLCFECFRIEVARRQAVAARVSNGWNAHQVSLPLSETLEQVGRRRRRAQIAARKALGA